ncbi:hypothetical protein TEA_004279 [Camellia sinensis var. sinensis]|uniref:Uncharacterized protein n=1 Tax=Camellia sinensis var. sinensis TaxID=542762 RepID=A0A4S4E7F9_CAMSN|nr:hypothetical protein TEA_004279 [Camellia sinensis var. sinensis]
MVELVNKIIKEKRNSGIPEVPKDVADVLIGNGSEKLTEDLISDNMIDLMIPGEDSVPVLITLAQTKDKVPAHSHIAEIIPADAQTTPIHNHLSNPADHNISDVTMNFKAAATQQNKTD